MNDEYTYQDNQSQDGPATCGQRRNEGHILFRVGDGKCASHIFTVGDRPAVLTAFNLSAGACIKVEMITGCDNEIIADFTRNCGCAMTLSERNAKAAIAFPGKYRLTWCDCDADTGHVELTFGQVPAQLLESGCMSSCCNTPIPANVISGHPCLTVNATGAGNQVFVLGLDIGCLCAALSACLRTSVVSIHPAITVGGTGNPYTIDLDLCDLTPADIDCLISGDPNNIIGRGTDGRLFAECCPTHAPAVLVSQDPILTITASGLDNQTFTFAMNFCNLQAADLNCLCAALEPCILALIPPATPQLPLTTSAQLTCNPVAATHPTIAQVSNWVDRGIEWDAVPIVGYTSTCNRIAIGAADANVSGANSATIASGLCVVTGTRTLVSGLENNVAAENAYVAGASHTVSGGNHLVAGTTNVVSNTHNIVSGFSQDVSGSSNIVSGTNNTVAASNVLVTGTGNNVSVLAISSAVSGRTNVVTGSRGLTTGEFNTVAGANNIVGGRLHAIAATCSNSLIIGADHDVIGTNNVVSGQTNLASGARNAVSGELNDVRFDNNLVYGRLNVVTNVGGNNLVGGSTNTYSGNNGAVFGQENNITADRVLLQGERSTVTGYNALVNGADMMVGGVNTFTTGIGHTNNSDKSAVFGEYNAAVAGIQRTAVFGRNTSSVQDDTVVGGFGPGPAGPALSSNRSWQFHNPTGNLFLAGAVTAGFVFPGFGEYFVGDIPEGRFAATKDGISAVLAAAIEDVVGITRKELAMSSGGGIDPDNSPFLLDAMGNRVTAEQEEVSELYHGTTEAEAAARNKRRDERIAAAVARVPKQEGDPEILPLTPLVAKPRRSGVEYVERNGEVFEVKRFKIMAPVRNPKHDPRKVAPKIGVEFMGRCFLEVDETVTAGAWVTVASDGSGRGTLSKERTPFRAATVAGGKALILARIG